MKASTISPASNARRRSARAAERTGVTKSRISQIERGEVSTIGAVARYVQSIGSRIQISAVFGDDHYILRGTVTEPV
jgi:transcriptional regulator with XRE-family HTH domain